MVLIISEDGIDILIKYGTMSVNVKYSKGALLTYSLIAHSPYEGWRMAINDTKGRLEGEQFHSGHRVGEPIQDIRFYNRKGEEVIYKIMKASGEHSGGDERIRRMIFVGDVPDPLGHQGDSWAGAMSLLIGVAANKSISQNGPIFIKDLLKGER